MNQPDQPPAHIPDRLRSLLALGHAERDAQIAAESARLHDELRSLAAYIPAIIIQQQLRDPAPGRVRGEYWDGSVLFADLSGFTALSERLSTLGKQGAEEISGIINQLFGALVDDILRYGGTVLKFGGDAITAFFAEESLGQQHAALATSAALALQQRMQSFAQTETRAGTFRLQLRIGVHSGRVFAAQVGDAEHIELVVTGRNINRVALAQEIAETGEIVISSATHALIAGAQTEERHAGFRLLTDFPQATPPAQASQPIWQPGPPSFAQLCRLDAYAEALRPYLPRQLPHRFLGDTPDESGEFRPVTVLFANFLPFSSALDILGENTATAAQVLNAYYQRAQSVVHRYGGIVNKVDMYTYGDKLMALFGAPSAHENDPELAVRAALDLQAELEHTNAEILALLRPAAKGLLAIDERFLKQRIGINTGVMFAGLVGSQQRREYTVMGQHVNLSARLMSAAEEGSVVLSPSTRRAVERHIALRPLEPIRLKGIAEPVAAAQAVRPLDFSQDLPTGLARAGLVGRAAEREQLLTIAQRALAGQGSVVSITGEAGIGKSRLIEELLRHMVLQSADPTQPMPPFFPYSVECQSYEQNTPYALIRQMLRQVLNLDFFESLGDTRSIERRIREFAPDLIRFTPLLSDLTVAHIADTELTAALSPEQRRDRARELAEAIFLNATRQQPIVFILDDLHWADASSLDLLAGLVRHATDAPLLMLLSYRRDSSAVDRWASLPNASHIAIGELSPELSARLVEQLLDSPLPADIAPLIEKTQGNPFYIEEVMHSLIESGLLVRSAEHGWQFTMPIDQAAIPDSIEGVIIARLDRLEERSREILQVASVVGRRFPYQVLSGVLLKTDDVKEKLGKLTDADLIQLEEIERELSYLFKHALTRDVAYEAILYARRRDLHRRVARQIETLYPERLDEQLGVLAHHYLLAEQWTQAFEYHMRAGRQAQSRYANREVIAFFERARQVAEKLPASAELGHALVEVHERLGFVYALIGEYDTALGHYQHALDLLHQQPDDIIGDAVDGVIRLHHHIARIYEKRADFETASGWIERALVFDPQIQSVESIRGLLLGAGLHKRQGRYFQSLEWSEQALRLADSAGHLREKAQAMKAIGNMHRTLGDNTQALPLLNECIALYQQTSDLIGLADAHNDLANTHYDLGQLDLADTHYRAGAEIKERIGDVYGQAMIANNLGELYRLQNKHNEAIESYQHSLHKFEQLGSLHAVGLLHMNLGATYMLLDQLDTAEQHFFQSADLFERASAEDFLPELERYLAELQMRRGDAPRALLAAELALTTAIRLEARAEEAITRRVLAAIHLQNEHYAEAWDEVCQSAQALRSAANPLEEVRALLLKARIAPYLSCYDHGQIAIDDAHRLLQSISAPQEQREIALIAEQHRYALPAPAVH